MNLRHGAAKIYPQFIEAHKILLLRMFVITFVIMCVIAGWSIYDQMYSQKNSFTRYATKIVATCAHAKYHPSCYEREIPKLTDTLSMEQMFQVVRIVQEKDQSYAYCHVLSHNISSIEVKKNPTKWQEVAARCPVSMCSNGCIHGAFQEYFRAESLSSSVFESVKQEIISVCADRAHRFSTYVQRFSCFHALGHLLMYATGADIHRSVEVCGEAAAGNQSFAQGCYDGAFMQIFQPLEPEDVALVAKIKPKKSELKTFCSDYTGNQHASCWREGWPLFFHKITDAPSTASFCQNLPVGREQSRCLDGLFDVMVVHFNFDQNKIISFCTKLPKNMQGKCFSESAHRFIYTDSRFSDKAIAVCTHANAYGIETQCLSELISRANQIFVAKSSDRYKFCGLVPAEFHEKCVTSLIEKK